MRETDSALRHAEPGEAEAEQPFGRGGAIGLVAERALFDQLPRHDGDRDRDGGRRDHHRRQRHRRKQQRQGLLDRKGVDVDAIGIVAELVEPADASARHIGFTVTVHFISPRRFFRSQSLRAQAGPLPMRRTHGVAGNRMRCHRNCCHRNCDERIGLLRRSPRGRGVSTICAELPLPT